jgi:zinc transporter ZupT
MSESNDTLTLRIVAIFVAIISSSLGFYVPYLRPKTLACDDISLSWMCLKAFSAGTILGVGVVHLLAEAIEALSDLDVSDYPIALTLAVGGISITLGIEMCALSLMTGVNNKVSINELEQDVNSGNSLTNLNLKEIQSHDHSNEIIPSEGTKIINNYQNIESNIDTIQNHNSSSKKEENFTDIEKNNNDIENHHDQHDENQNGSHHHHHHCHEHTCHEEHIHGHAMVVDKNHAKAIIKSIILEACISLHSIIIGISLGGMDKKTDSNSLTVLIVAYAFHQFFEGIVLGTGSLESKFDNKVTFWFWFVFIITVPVGIMIGIATNTSDSSEIISACANALASGSLIYTSLIEMVAEDFMHARVFYKPRLIPSMYFSFLLGFGFMALLANWA